MALKTSWETAFQAAVLAFVGILLTIMIGAACGLLLGGFDRFFNNEINSLIFLTWSAVIFLEISTLQKRQFEYFKLDIHRNPFRRFTSRSVFLSLFTSDEALN